MGLVALAVLIGWATGRATLVGVAPGWVSMKANTALSLLFAALALWLLRRADDGGGSRLRRRWASLCAIATGSIGALALVSELMDLDLGLDQALVRNFTAAVGTSQSGHMSPATAISGVLLSAALLAVDRGRSSVIRPAQLLAIAVLPLPLFGLVGHLYSVSSLYELLAGRQIAIHTSASLLLLGAGVLALRPRDGFMRRLTEESLTGRMLRALVPVVSVGPLVLGWLRLGAERLGLLVAGAGTAALVLATAVLLGFVVALLGFVLGREEDRRRTVEKDLRNGQRLMRLSSSLGHLGGWSVDLQRGDCEWSDEVCAIHEVPSGCRPTFAQAIEFYAPEWRETIRAAFEACTRDGTPFDLELQLITAKGRRTWVRALGEAAVDPQGRITHVQGAFQEINDRVAERQRLLQSEERFRATFEQAAVGIAHVAVEGGFLRVNQRYCDIVGYGHEEMLGITFQQITHPDDLDADLEHVRQVLAGEIQTYSMEKRYLRKGGGEVWVLLTVSLVRTTEGAPDYFIAVTEDITERIVAEERYGTVVRTTTAGFWIVDASGRLLEVNPAYCELSGYGRDELIGRSIDDLEATSAEGSMRRQIQAALASGAARFETRHRTKSGRLVEVEVNLRRLERAAAGSVFAFLTDISGRKLQEREREALVAELEARTHELEQVVYVTSHDLRTPLVNIQGFARELERAVQELLEQIDRSRQSALDPARLRALIEDDIKEALDYIGSSANRMDALLSGLLELSRAGRGMLAMVPVDMNELVDDALSTLRYEIDRQSVAIHVAELQPCQGDAAQLSKVVTNLLSNALKYLAPNRPGRVEIDSSSENGRVTYRVRDNGIGIAPEYQQKIFEAFHRLHPSETEGEGLGLAIAEKIVSLLGGRIWASSEPGRGSTFHVELPAADAG